jgi:hypothetical protein
MHLSGIERGAFQKHAIFRNLTHPRLSAPIYHHLNEFKQLARLRSRLFSPSKHIETDRTRKEVEKRPRIRFRWPRKDGLFQMICASFSVELSRGLAWLFYYFDTLPMSNGAA